MPVLPPELVREAIRFSLLPSSPALEHASWTSSSGVSTPASTLSYDSRSSRSSTPETSASSPASSTASFANPFDTSFASPDEKPVRPPLSRSAQLRVLSLTSHLFRALSQPLLFRSPVLPTLSSALTFLAAVEEDAGLARSVRKITLGQEVGEDGVRGGALDGKLVVARLAKVCGKVREVKLMGCGRVRVEDLLGFEELQAPTLTSCLLAPSTSYAPSTPGLRNLTHLTLSSCHLTSHALPASLFPSLTALELTTPRDSIASSPGQLASFLSAVAPRLRSFSLFDQTASPFTGGGQQPGIEFNPLFDALSSFSTSNLVHFESTNAHPLTYLPYFSPSARRSLRTISMSLAGALDPATCRMRWMPLVDSLLRDTLSLLTAVLAPSSRVWDAPALPAWIAELEGLERVSLPERAWEVEGLRGMVDELERALEVGGKRVEVVPLTTEGGEGGVAEEEVKEGRGKSGFWGEVERREKEEREEKRRTDGGWW